MNTTSMLCSLRSAITCSPDRLFPLLESIAVNSIIGHPSLVSNLFAPVKFAVTFGSQPTGSCPAFQAMATSTKNSGSVWTIATIDNARPWLIEYCDASAAQAIIMAAAITEAKVKRARISVREEKDVDEAENIRTKATPTTKVIVRTAKFLRTLLSCRDLPIRIRTVAALFLH